MSDEAAQMAAQASGGDPETQAPQMDEEPEGDDEGGLVSALFESDPDIDPAGIDAHPVIAELYVGTRKLMHGLGIETGDADDGTPAVVHYVRSVWYAVQMRQAQAQEQGDGEEADDGTEVVQA